MILNKIKQHEQLDEEIRDYLYPKIEMLSKEGLLKSSPGDRIGIDEVYINKNKIIINYSFYWAYGGYDSDAIALEESDLENIEDYIEQEKSRLEKESEERKKQEDEKLLEKEKEEYERLKEKFES